MTAGGASETPAAEAVSGLSTLSPLVELKTELIHHLFDLFGKLYIHADYF